MNPASIAEQMDARLATLPGLVAHYIGARKSVSVPCSVVLLPDPIDYQQVYSSGAVRIEDWEIIVLTGLPDDHKAYERILRYAGTGTGTVKQVLESNDAPLAPYTGVDVVKLNTCDFGIIEWQGQQFQGATFSIDVYAS